MRASYTHTRRIRAATDFTRLVVFSTSETYAAFNASLTYDRSRCDPLLLGVPNILGIFYRE